jgi:hypothetical protein
VSKTTYSLTKDEAVNLGAMSFMPHDMRLELLEKYHREHGTAALIRMFSQFVALTKSIEENTREFIEMYLICECNHTPENAEKINLPTILGACQGAQMAIPPTKGMCDGCAFRIGTAANQSIVTTADATYCSEDRVKFMCHESLDERGEATKPCAGYAREHAKNFLMAGEDSRG